MRCYVRAIPSVRSRARFCTKNGAAHSSALAVTAICSPRPPNLTAALAGRASGRRLKGDRHDKGHVVGHGTDRRPLQPLWRPPWPRLRRWPKADGPSLLHEWCRPEVQTDDRLRARNHDPNSVGLSRRRSDHCQPLYSPYPALRVRPGGPVLHPRRAAVAGRHGCDLCRGGDLGRHRRRVGCRGQSVWPHRSFSSFGPFRRYAAVPRVVRPDDAARRRVGRALVPVCGAGRHGRRIFDPALSPAWGRDGPALGSLRRPIVGLDPDRGRAPGSKHTNLAAAHRLCSRRGHFACARSPCRRADLCRDEAFARDRRMGAAGSGRRDSHCGRRDRIGSRHRLSHPRVPRKHGFARTRLARQIPFRGGRPTTAVRDHVRRPGDDDPQSRLDDEGQANGSSSKNSPSRASCLRCLARLHG
jgi:hypothetical protein